MGLDMFLSNKVYLSKYSNPSDTDKIDQVNEVFDIQGDEDGDYGVKQVEFRVAYWRKANAIHAWFVKNVQNGVDDSHQAYVSREQLEDLVELCKRVIEKPKLSNELLPPQSGFFFGSTEVDEWYLQDLDHTVKTLQKALAEPTFKKGDFYYQSSW